MAIRTWIPLSLAVALLSACQTQRAIKESDELRQKGDIIRSVEVLQAEARQAPDDVQLRTANFSKLELLVAKVEALQNEDYEKLEGIRNELAKLD